MMFEDIEPLIKLSDIDKIEFDKFIKENRKKIIMPPKETTKKVVENDLSLFKNLLKSGEISRCINLLRELSYDEFLKEEAEFNAVILSEIGRKFKVPCGAKRCEESGEIKKQTKCNRL